MMKYLKLFAVMPLLWLSVFLYGAVDVAVDPNHAVIVLPENAGPIRRFAALELQKHLELITGTLLPIRPRSENGMYPFYLGPPAGTDLKEQVREEAHWLVTPEGTWLYGEDFQGIPAKTVNDFSPVFSKASRTGTLFAVYDFLEKELGILWLEPGDDGIVYPSTAKLKLAAGSGSWSPGGLIQRQIRTGYSSWKHYSEQVAPTLPESFRQNREQYEKSSEAVHIWLKRQRMGNSSPMSYGHAFTHWWKLYGKEHPEYFAMQADGVRRPENQQQPDRCKICVSNPAVHNRIVANWRAEKNPSQIINVCENDSGGYCRCPECLKLDAPLKGEKFADNLSDRYVWFANAVRRKAAEFNPDASVIMYAYSCYRFPPRREKVDPQVIIGFVPSMMMLEQVERMYRGWKQAGAQKLFLRPNDQHVNTGLPMGFEKQMFDHFQLGIKNGIIGSDYDSLHNFWPATGFADYVLARAHTDPSKSFEHWENEYCSAYGAAKDKVRDYFRYWRQNIWEKRLTPNMAKIRERGRYGNFRRGLMWDINKYYTPADFEATDAILAEAAGQKLSASERHRLETLQLANRHARLAYQALVAPPSQKFLEGRKLLEFREKHRDDLNFNWGALLKIEQDFGDVSGITAAARFQEYSNALALPEQWYFQIDPENIGLQEHWENYSWHRIRTTWDPIQVNSCWENQSLKEMHPKLKKILKNYDGIGFYAQSIKVPAEWKGSPVYLFFGAVDESAQVYLNGKFAGEHLFQNTDDWKTPFAIRIDSLVDWDAPSQTVVVRVEDKNGSGGIWKPVFLTRKKRSEEQK